MDGRCDGRRRVLRHYRGMIVTITAGESTRNVRTPFLFVGNNEYQSKASVSVRGRLDGAGCSRTWRRASMARAAECCLALVGREQHTLESFAAAAPDRYAARRPGAVALDGRCCS